jgi:hypothetical protein
MPLSHEAGCRRARQPALDLFTGEQHALLRAAIERARVGIEEYGGGSLPTHLYQFYTTHSNKAATDPATSVTATATSVTATATIDTLIATSAITTTTSVTSTATDTAATL